MFHMEGLPGTGGIMPFEPLDGFSCETSVQEVKTFTAGSLTAIEKF